MAANAGVLVVTDLETLPDSVEQWVNKSLEGKLSGGVPLQILTRIQEAGKRFSDFCFSFPRFKSCQVQIHFCLRMYDARVLMLLWSCKLVEFAMSNILFHQPTVTVFSASFSINEVFLILKFHLIHDFRVGQLDSHTCQFFVFCY
jgi:hypothetical protein